MKRIIRIFPTKTTMVPNDRLARIGCIGPSLIDEADEVHISVIFTWDVPKAEALEKLWRRVAPVKIGGPGTEMRGEEFTPGMYVRLGGVITSRGCPNRCFFCSVWKRDGKTRELATIHDGYNVMDDNILACSESHIRKVFAMLQRQKHPIEFSGGWEAKIMKPWHVDLLTTLTIDQVWFAYDTPDDLEPLIAAGKLLKEAGLNYSSTGHVSHKYRCYVLTGFPKDTFDAADKRMRQAYAAGFLPQSMLYRDKHGNQPYAWRKFHQHWCRAVVITAMLRDNTQAMHMY